MGSIKYDIFLKIDARREDENTSKSNIGDEGMAPWHAGLGHEAHSEIVGLMGALGVGACSIPCPPEQGVVAWAAPRSCSWTCA